MRYLIISLILILLTSCRYDFAGFVSPPSKTVETRFEESMQLNTSDTVISLPSISYQMAFCSDVHVNDRAHNLHLFLNEVKKNKDILATAILGDITDMPGGMFIAKDTIISAKLDIPIKYVVGNHDLYFDQWEDFKECFGSASYYFIIQADTVSDLFIVLDSGSGTIGKKQLAWLEDILKSRRSLHRHCIVLTHTHFWDSEMSQFPTGNFPVEETAVLTNLFTKYGVDLVLSGHDHKAEVKMFNDVCYIVTDAIHDGVEKWSYLIVKFDDKIDYTFCNM